MFCKQIIRKMKKKLINTTLRGARALHNFGSKPFYDFKQVGSSMQLREIWQVTIGEEICCKESNINNL